MPRQSIIELDKDLFESILDLYRDQAKKGDFNVKYNEIAELCRCTPRAVYHWYENNTFNFKTALQAIQSDYLIKHSIDALSKSLKSDDEKIRLDASKFTLSKLDKRFNDKVEINHKHHLEELSEVQLKTMLEAKLRSMAVTVDGELVDTTLDESTKLLNASDEEA